MTHTRTPWNMCGKGIGFTFIENEDGINIAQCEFKEDAKHIIKCVNSHEKLIEALEYLLKEAEITLPHCSDEEDKYWVQHAIDLGKQALKEGEKL